MKKIQAIVKPEVVEAVTLALEKVGFFGFLFDSKVKGKGNVVCNQSCTTCTKPDLIPRAVIDVFVQDGDVQEVCTIIHDKAGNGRSGSGKIFVFPIGEVIDISTDRRGEEVIERTTL